MLRAAMRSSDTPASRRVWIWASAADGAGAGRTAGRTAGLGPVIPVGAAELIVFAGITGIAGRPVASVFAGIRATDFTAPTAFGATPATDFTAPAAAGAFTRAFAAPTTDFTAPTPRAASFDSPGERASKTPISRAPAVLAEVEASFWKWRRLISSRCSAIVAG